MSPEEERDFRNSTSCDICGRKYKAGDENGPVRDHCHITGKYRGSAHNDCNLKLRLEPESRYLSYFITLKAMIAILLCKQSVK